MVLSIRMERCEDSYLVIMRGKGSTGKRGREVLAGVAQEDLKGAIEDMAKVLEERLELA